MQVRHGGHVTIEDKAELRRRLRTLEDELNCYLAGEYGVQAEDDGQFADWKQSHQPFHWLVEFLGIVRQGGFDVIIGNPPYLERSKFGNAYRVRNLKTLDCRDIYSWVVERVLSLAPRDGSQGMIVPVSLASSASFEILRNVLSDGATCLWLSHFANRPGQLFTGAQNRLTIFVRTGRGNATETFSTRYHRWDARRNERDALFSMLQYVPLGKLARSFHGLYPKVGTSEAIGVLARTAVDTALGFEFRSSSAYPIYWVRVPGYFCQFFLDPPKARPERGGPLRVRGEVKEVFLSDEKVQRVVHAILNSSTYYQFFCAYTDGRHINPSDVKDYPLKPAALGTRTTQKLVRLSRKLEQAMIANTTQWRKSGLLIDSVDSAPTKPIIDGIDAVLGEHFGFTDAELDYVVNYDVKHRMGGSDDENAE